MNIKPKWRRGFTLIEFLVVIASTVLHLTARPNHPPVISGLSNTNTPANIRLNLNFNISDVETPISNLVVTAFSSNDLLGSVSLDTNGPNPVLVFNPAGIANTNVTVSVLVSDGQLSTTNSFVIEITPAAGPGISAIPDQTASISTSALVEFTITNSPSTNVTIKATASNTNLISRITVGGSGTNRTALIVLVPDRFGLSEIDITISDDFGSASSAFLLRTSEHNPPFFGPIPDQITDQDVPITIDLPVSDPDTQLSVLMFTWTASNTNLVSGVVFDQTGTNVLATVNLVSNQSGLSTVTISVTYGAYSISRTFALSVLPVHEFLLVPIGDRFASPNSLVTVPLIVKTEGSSSISGLIFSGTSSNPNLVARDIRFNNDGTNVSALINLVPGAVGVSSVTITVNDGTSSVTRSFVLTVAKSGLEHFSIMRSATKLTITMTGTPGTSYVIETTTDFETWNTFDATTIDSDGSTDLQIGMFKTSQFFRARNP